MPRPGRGRGLQHAVPLRATAVLATTGVGLCTRSISLSGCFAISTSQRQASSSGSQTNTAGVARKPVPVATFGSTATGGGHLAAIFIGGAAEDAKPEAEAPNNEAAGTDAAEEEAEEEEEEATKGTEQSTEQEKPEQAKAEKRSKKAMAEAEKTAASEEIKKVMDEFLRLQADLQNYRRKHTESMSRAEELGKRDALKDLVPFSDDIAAALVKPENMTEKETALYESYTLLFRKVEDAYAKFGVEPTETQVGDKLDPVLHLKVEEREAPNDESPGTILEVVKQGCKCDGKILIPSEVAIVAFPAAAEGAQEETDDEDAGDDREMVPDEAADTNPEDGEGASATEESKEDEAKTDKS